MHLLTSAGLMPTQTTSRDNVIPFDPPAWLNDAPDWAEMPDWAEPAEPAMRGDRRG